MDAVMWTAKPHPHHPERASRVRSFVDDCVYTKRRRCQDFAESYWIGVDYFVVLQEMKLSLLQGYDNRVHMSHLDYRIQAEGTVLL